MEHPKHDGVAGPVEIAMPPPKGPPILRQRKATKSAPHSMLGAVKAAVQVFLASEFDAREVQITKIGPSPVDPHGWYVEAEIMVPDLGMKALGLPLTQEVLERELCALDLDSEMNVKSCEVVAPRDQ
jgi:hypothetical protein